MGKTRDLFKKIRDTKGTFHAKMGSIKGRNGMDLTEAEDIKKRWQEYTEELYKKDLNGSDNHHGVITHLEPDILECKVKWALGSITTKLVEVVEFHSSYFKFYTFHCSETAFRDGDPSGKVPGVERGRVAPPYARSPSHQALGGERRLRWHRKKGGDSADCQPNPGILEIDSSLNPQRLAQTQTRRPLREGQMNQSIQ